MAAEHGSPSDELHQRLLSCVGGLEVLGEDGGAACEGKHEQVVGEDELLDFAAVFDTEEIVEVEAMVVLKA